MKITIDGPAGSGKSTIARALAERCGLTYLDTGAMYRAVTWGCLARGVDPSDAAAVTKVARDSKIEFGPMKAGKQRVFLNGEDVTSQIRTAEVDKNVSAVSSIPAVREVMTSLQRTFGEQGDVVAEGRDIGTVVFPTAEVKVFLTADPAARAHRRAVQREGGDAAHNTQATADPKAEQEILADLERRDKLDSSREVAPLRPAEDAVHIDSSNLTVEEELSRIEDLMRKAGFKGDKGKAQEKAPDQSSESVKPAAAKPAQGGTGATSSAKPEQVKGVHKVTKAEKAPKGPLKAFHHATFDDYFDRPMKYFPLTSKAALATAVYIVGAITKVAWRWRVEDGEKLWNHKGGAMIVMNHASMLEPVAVIISEWMHHHRVRAIYKSEFNKHAATMWAFSRSGAIPVTRGTADVEAVRRAQHAMKNGEDVLVYPEGTRIKSDDQPVTLHAGFALMALMAKADVIPMAVVGARDITPPNTHAKRFHNVYLKVGDPISFKDLGVNGRKAQCNAMEKVAMERVYALRDELRREHPGKM